MNEMRDFNAHNIIKAHNRGYSTKRAYIVTSVLAVSLLGRF